MSVHQFAHALDHKIGAQREGLATERRRKRIVDDQQGLTALGHFCERGEICNACQWIGDGLHQQEARFGF